MHFLAIFGEKALILHLKTREKLFLHPFEGGREGRIETVIKFL